MFKKKQLILYPNHGVGKIKKISSIKSDEKKVDYYDIEFHDSDISVSIPVENAQSLGLSAIPTKKAIVKALTGLGKRVKVDEEKAKDIEAITTADINTTDVDKIVSLVNKIESYKEYRGKSLGSGLYKVLSMANQFLGSAALFAVGKKGLKKYPTLNEAS